MSPSPESPATRRAVDPRGRFHLDLPATWAVRTDVDGADLTAAEPLPVAPDGAEAEPVTGYRANVLVDSAVLEPGTDLETWQQGVDADLAASLRELLLVDRRTVDLGGRPAVHRVAEHLAESSVPVTVVQWAVRDGDVGRTLTATSATLDHDRLADDFAAAAASWTPGTGRR
jgi:hypothetical protein